MKLRHWFAVLAWMTIAFGCKQTEKTHSVLNPDALPSQFVQINTKSDTIVTLKGGTLLHILKNTLQVQGSTTAQLEIKEALTIEDIVLAGLTTQSNGQPLQSGGMLYINAAYNLKIEFLKPMKIELPANFIDKKMSVFKGEEKEGKVNWVDPKPVTFVENQSGQGQSLFAANCASCHNVNRESTGPALYGSMERWHNDTDLVYNYTRNSLTVMATNSYACCLFNQYNKTPMTLFPSLTKVDLNALYRYIDEEGRKVWGEVPPHLKNNSSCDSCGAYQQRLAKLLQKKNLLKEELANRQITDTISWNSPSVANEDTVDEKYVPNYYTVEINTFGWFNIDCFLKANPSVQESQLIVRMKGTYNSSTRVLLAIPAYKVLTEGYFSEDKKEYIFYDNKTSIPLPQGVEGCIIATGDGPEPNQLVYGVSRFIISRSQQVTVSVKPATADEIRSGIRALRFPDLDINVRKDTLMMNAQIIDQQIDSLQQVAKLKLPYCDCSSDVRDTMAKLPLPAGN